MLDGGQTELGQATLCEGGSPRSASLGDSDPAIWIARKHSSHGPDTASRTRKGVWWCSAGDGRNRPQLMVHKGNIGDPGQSPEVLHFSFLFLLTFSPFFFLSSLLLSFHKRTPHPSPAPSHSQSQRPGLGSQHLHGDEDGSMAEAVSESSRRPGTGAHHVDPQYPFIVVSPFRQSLSSLLICLYSFVWPVSG